MGIEARYQDLLNTGRITPDPAQHAAIEALARVESELLAPAKLGFFRRKAPAVRGLYLWGGVGRGKSMLMDLFADDIAEALQGAVRRVHFHALMQEVHRALHAQADKSPHDAILPVADALGDGLRVLALDEMQITDITDAMIVGRLFERLIKNGVTLITTSNRPPEDLYKDGLNRALFLPFIELLTSALDVHELTSNLDYRRNRLKGSERYFHPITAESRAAMNGIWADLTEGRDAPLALSVLGRTVTLPAHQNGMARARFFDLCGKPLGPADYLAIARSLRLLMLEDIPRLSRENFNEARRFVTLIDALYEAKVQLIASASAAPDMLYIEGEGRFEFDRTASRLFEMQSEDWGQ